MSRTQEIRLLKVTEETLKYLHGQPPGDVRNDLLAHWTEIRSEVAARIRPTPVLDGNYIGRVASDPP